jgi:predicted MFS family arabinose efflux permease
MTSGALVAPLLITIFSLAERLVPNAQLTEGLTFMNSGLTVGLALGITAGGYLIDVSGASVGFALGAGAAAGAFLVALIGRGRLKRSVRADGFIPPTSALNTEPVPGPAPGGFDLDDR